MKRSIARWIATLSTAAALGLPVTAAAQTPEPQTAPQQTPPQQARPQEPQQPPTQSQPAEPAAAQPGAEQPSSPEEHLRQAKAALDRIESTSLTSETRTKLAELKRHMSALERGGEESASTAASAKGKTPASNASWGTEVAAMDKILADLLGPDSSTGTKGMTGTTAAPGTAGTTGSKAAATVALDEATRSALTEVRSHIVAYAARKSGAPAPKGEAAMASPKADTPAATPAEEPAAAAAAAPAAEPAAAPSTGPAATPQQDPAAAPSTAAAAPQQPADQQAARRHLLAARDALNQLTQLPAAAQLTGHTREQVSQLIANFNELITTQSQWRASYAKVTSNLTALLGPDTTGADTAAALPPAAPESTAAPGAVGTSGAGAAEMDPAVRAKLVELRRNLTEFETALGGPEK